MADINNNTNNIQKQRVSGIYEIRCILNNQIYIGSSVDLKRREKDHFNGLVKNIHRNRKLQRSFNKYGIDNFKFTAIEIITDPSQLIQREQFYVDSLNPYFNICKIVVNSSLGIKRSKEFCDKISKRQLGTKHSQERRINKSIAQGGENHWTKKKNFSEESKRKMSESHKERLRNGGETFFTKNKLTVEQIEKRVKKICKKVIQLDLNNNFIKEWNSIIECKSFGYLPSNIVQCCKGKAGTYKNFKWVYKIDYNEFDA